MPQIIKKNDQEFIEDNRPFSVSMTALNRERLLVLMDMWEGNRSNVINRSIALAYNAMIQQRKAKDPLA